MAIIGEQQPGDAPRRPVLVAELDGIKHYAMPDGGEVQIIGGTYTADGLFLDGYDLVRERAFQIRPSDFFFPRPEQADL